MKRQDMASALAHGSRADVPVVWQVGDIILNQYQVKGILGEGGMGTVYLVHHQGWNIELAVKSPRPAIFAREGGKENFIREAETWVGLGLHPHIVSCYYARTLGNIPRVFAEYVDGGSLSDWVRTRRLYEGGPGQTLPCMLDIAIQFAWGLHAAHEQGLVHQDVKPLNVMMTAEGTVKVTDFGLTKARALAGEAGVLGGEQSILVSSRGKSPAYCSPEQDRGAFLSRKTDIWSWGVSVLEMFIGGVTWAVGTVAQEVLDSYEAQDRMIPPMPAELITLLRRCFQPQPEDRPATMLEIAAELQTLYIRLTGQAYPRQAPKAAEMVADSLNNRALSLFDLGKLEEAMQTWNQALHIDRQHLETIYNRGMALWRQREITDDVLVRQLEEVQATLGEHWQTRYLLAQVHLERGDRRAARSLLEKAAKQAPEEPEVQALLKQVQPDTFPTDASGRAFTGHTEQVSSVSLRGDGQLVLSGSWDKMVRLWDVETGRCIRTFEGHTGIVSAVSLSSDGRWALSGSTQRMGDAKKIDYRVWLWDVETGRCKNTFRGHTSVVSAVSLSADGRWALSGSWDKTLRLWEVETGLCKRTFAGHTDVVCTVSLSADGRVALSGSWDKTARLWEVATGRCLYIFGEHKGMVSAVCLSADGRWALSGGWDKTLRLWEVETGRCARTFEGHLSGVSSVCLSADGSWALSGSDDKTVRLWEVATGRCMRTFKSHTDMVSAVSLSADGRRALSGSKDKTVRLWEMPTTERFFSQVRLSLVRSHADVLRVETEAVGLLRQAEEAIEKGWFAKALDLAGRARALPGWERSPACMETWTKLLLHCQKASLRTAWQARIFEGHTDTVYAVSLSADGRWAFSGSSDRTVRLWDVETGRCVHIFEGSRGILSVCVSADGQWVLSGNWDNKVHLWEVATGRCVRTFEGHTGEVHSVWLSRDGRRVFSGSGDGKVKLWEVSSGRCVRTFWRNSSSVNAVSLNADESLVLSVSSGMMRLWEVATGRCERTFEGHTGGVATVSLSADERWIFSGSSDGLVRQWEVATGRCVRAFKGHTARVRAVSVSADERWVLSGSDDRTARLWEVATGRCIRIFEGHTSGVNAVSLSADGRRVLSGSWDKTVRLWECDWELKACESVDWDEGAFSLLDNFLALHVPFAGELPQEREPSKKEVQQALTRCGRPSWNEEDFQDLIRQLQYGGYGWLRPEGVRRQLEQMAASWQGPVTLRSGWWRKNETRSDQDTTSDMDQNHRRSLWERLFH